MANTTKKVENGGSVFPRVTSSLGQDSYSLKNYTAIESTGGMSLRDYFAAHAIRACFNSDATFHVDRVAEVAYQVADAMLKARSSPEDV
jgi:hypothetical protein